MKGWFEESSFFPGEDNNTAYENCLYVKTKILCNLMRKIQCIYISLIIRMGNRSLNLSRPVVVVLFESEFDSMVELYRGVQAYAETTGAWRPIPLNLGKKIVNKMNNLIPCF